MHGSSRPWGHSWGGFSVALIPGARQPLRQGLHVVRSLTSNTTATHSSSSPSSPMLVFRTPGGWVWVGGGLGGVPDRVEIQGNKMCGWNAIEVLWVTTPAVAIWSPCILIKLQSGISEPCVITQIRPAGKRGSPVEIGPVGQRGRQLRNKKTDAKGSRGKLHCVGHQTMEGSQWSQSARATCWS